MLLLDAIQIGAHEKFATTFAIYQAATGAGNIRDLFATHLEQQETEPERLKLQRIDTVQSAQEVMEANTTKLDNHRSFF
jgi:hypothetical protein